MEPARLVFTEKLQCLGIIAERTSCIAVVTLYVFYFTAIEHCGDMYTLQG